MPPTPRKRSLKKNAWDNVSGYENTRKVRDFGLREDLAKEWLEEGSTPRKATPLNVRPAKYGGIEKYAVGMVYEDRRDAEAHVWAVNCHAELVHMVDELTRWAESVEGKQVSIGATRWGDSIFTQARKLIAKASHPE